MLKHVTAMAELALSDEEDKTDDDMVVSSAFMARTLPVNDHPGDFSINPDNILEVRAHFEYSFIPELQSKLNAISDSGADSCILGKMAKVISYTGRYANLVGYDPSTTRTEKLPIVSLY